MKTATKYDFFVEEYGARHELTLQAKEKHKQAYKNVLEGRQEHHIDALLEILSLCSNPELRVITTREQFMELLSFANVEKARKGRFDDELFEASKNGAPLPVLRQGGPAQTPVVLHMQAGLFTATRSARARTGRSTRRPASPPGMPSKTLPGVAFWRAMMLVKTLP